MSAFAALFSSSRAMMTQSHVMERISGNVSNMNTVGYKAFDAHLRESINHITPQGKHFSVGSVDVRQATKQGILLTTGRSLDLAVNGPGYFITNPEFEGTGEQHYTRNGSFQKKLADDGNAYLATMNGHYVLGWEAGEDGTVEAGGEPMPIEIDNVDPLPGEVTTEASFAANVDANATKAHTFAVNIWSNPDAEGNNDPHSLVMTWTPDPLVQNDWSVTYATRGPSGVLTPSATAATPVTFNPDGTLAAPTGPTSVDVTFDDGTSSTVALDLSDMTQYGESGFNEIYQSANGFSEGRVSGVGFDEFGRLTKYYSNGQSRVTHQVALVDFTAPQNLTDAGETMFTFNEEAGEMDIFGIENSFDRAAIAPGVLEQSNVDLATEFSRMIMTQKAYSCSATVFRSTDEMIRTASDLKR